jgi:DNA gyrase/topoisomerase IV subunit B
MIQSVFYPCRLKNNTDTEIFLTEGDSAGGQVSKARDTDTQAVFQLKGKPPNAMRIKVSKLMQNVVFRDLARILGVGPTDTDLKNMNFRNIGILVDADPDGYHISSLLIGNLYKLNPLILEEGRVFLANPPLYTMTVKNSSAFIRDTHALMDMRINRIYRSCIEITIRGSSKKLMKLSGEPYREFCYLVRHIGGTIKQVATKLVIDPMIVEMLTHCVDHIEPGHVNPQAIAKILGLKQVFYHADSNSLILNAGVDITVPLSNLALEIRKYILPHLERIRWRDFDIWCTTPITKHYNNTAVSLMQLYSIFDAVDSAYPVHRIKGLGEMTRLQLLETCTNPQTRTQTVITSVGDVDRLYAMLGVDVSARKTLIDSDMEEDTDSLEREG